MLDYAEDRDAKISIIQSILKKNHGAALPKDLPRDLVLEAKVHLGKDSDQWKTISGSGMDILPHALINNAEISSAGNPSTLIIDKEKHVGHILSDEEAIYISLLNASHDSGPVVEDPHVESANVDNHISSDNTQFWSSLF